MWENQQKIWISSPGDKHRHPVQWLRCFSLATAPDLCVTNLRRVQCMVIRLRRYFSTACRWNLGFILNLYFFLRWVIKKRGWQDHVWKQSIENITHYFKFMIQLNIYIYFLFYFGKQSQMHFDDNNSQRHWYIWQRCKAHVVIYWKCQIDRFIESVKCIFQ